jgi:hypothetical protein
MLTVITVFARLTRWKTKNKSLPFYFRDSVALHKLEHSITNQIKCIVSQLERANYEVYARGDREPQLAG